MDAVPARVDRPRGLEITQKESESYPDVFMFELKRR
jgi:hypothetical protein